MTKNNICNFVLFWHIANFLLMLYEEKKVENKVILNCDICVHLCLIGAMRYLW